MGKGNQAQGTFVSDSFLPFLKLNCEYISIQEFVLNWLPVMALCDMLLSKLSG